MFTFKKISNNTVEVTADSIEAIGIFMYYAVMFAFSYVDDKYPDGNFLEEYYEVAENKDDLEDWSEWDEGEARDFHRE